MDGRPHYITRGVGYAHGNSNAPSVCPTALHKNDGAVIASGTPSRSAAAAAAAVRARGGTWVRGALAPSWCTAAGGAGAGRAPRRRRLPQPAAI